MQGLKRNWKWGVVLASALVALTAQAREEAKEMGKEAGKKVAFVNDIARFDENQIMLGKMAEQKSNNPQVQELARNLVERHQEHLNELMNWADQRSVEISTVMNMEPGMGGGGAAGMTQGGKAMTGMGEEMQKYEKELGRQDEKAAETWSKLKSAEGEKFDKEFLATVQKSQKKGIEKVRAGERKYKDDATFAALLKKTEPVLSSNLEEAKAAEKSVKAM